MNAYDIMLIFPSALKAEEIETALGRIGDEMARLGGQVTQTESMGERNFARPMQKHESGHYYMLQCQLDPASITLLQGRMKLIEDIFRVQIVKSPPVVEPTAAEVEAEKTAEAASTVEPETPPVDGEESHHA